MGATASGIRRGALAAGLAGLAAAAAAQAPRPFPDTTAHIRVFNDQLATWSMSEEQVRFAALHYAGAQKLVRSAPRHLRQYAPGFLVLHYRLGQALGHSLPSACLPPTSWIEIVVGDGWVPEWPGDGAVVERRRRARCIERRPHARVWHNPSLPLDGARRHSRRLQRLSGDLRFHFKYSVAHTVLDPQTALHPAGAGEPRAGKEDLAHRAQ